MNQSPEKTMLISKGWIQAVALVMLFGFFIMGLLTYYTYTDEPPIPAKVVDASGNVLFTGADITAIRNHPPEKVLGNFPRYTNCGGQAHRKVRSVCWAQRMNLWSPRQPDHLPSPWIG